MTDEDRPARTSRREKRYDNVFWFGVSTTGLYCRPSCPSRFAPPEQVSFHMSPETAKRAGFRPCRRCDPDGLIGEAAELARIEKACRFAVGAGRRPSVAAFAALAGLETTRFRTVFRRNLGLFPGAWLRDQRLDRRATAGLPGRRPGRPA